MSSNGSPLKTNDLALATYLSVNGIEYELDQEKRGDGMAVCLWIFPSSDVSRRLLAEYVSRTASVEPNKFVRTWGVIRKEMLEYLHAPTR